MKNCNVLKILGIVSSILGMALPLLDDYLDEKNTRAIVQDEVQKALAQSSEEES